MCRDPRAQCIDEHRSFRPAHGRDELGPRLERLPLRGTSDAVPLDAGGEVVVVRRRRGDVGDGRGQTGDESLGHRGLAGTRAAEDEGDHRRAPARTAVCTARAKRAPHVDRGPPNGSSRPSSGQAMTTASVAVPVPGTPQSNILLTVMHKLGIETDSVGDSTGTIAI